MGNNESRIDLLAGAIENIGRNAAQLEASYLVGFFGSTGRLYDNELLLVGRSVNGWIVDWEPSEGSDPRRAREIAATIAAVSEPCSMSWVSDNSGYNARRSAFWRTAKLVQAGVNPSVEDDWFWPSHLAWTNLYKISPYDGGNPSNRLCKLQYNACIAIFRDEIASLMPKRILFSTGHWANDFLIDLKANVTEADTKYVESFGTIPIGRQKARFVVAAHPQGKREAEWADEVIQAFS